MVVERVLHEFRVRVPVEHLRALEAQLALVARRALGAVGRDQSDLHTGRRTPFRRRELLVGVVERGRRRNRELGEAPTRAARRARRAPRCTSRGARASSARRLRCTIAAAGTAAPGRACVARPCTPGRTGSRCRGTSRRASAMTSGLCSASNTGIVTMRTPVSSDEMTTAAPPMCGEVLRHDHAAELGGVVHLGDQAEIRLPARPAAPGAVQQRMRERIDDVIELRRPRLRLLDARLQPLHALLVQHLGAPAEHRSRAAPAWCRSGSSPARRRRRRPG